MVRARVIAPLLGLSILVACSTTPETSSPTGGSLSGTDEQIFLGDTLEKNYDPHVIMKRAEAFFERESYAEAIVEYQHFLDMHRGHVLAPYAQYRLGESHFKMAKSVDRDPEPIIKALRSFERQLEVYPGSKYEIDALVHIRECRNWLANVDIFVGRFYLGQGSYLAAAHRFERVLEADRELDAAPDALYYLALAYKELGADDWAKEKLIMLAERYPHNGHQDESRRLLADLGGAPAPAALARSLPAARVPGTAAAAVNGSYPPDALALGPPQANGHHPMLDRPRIEPAAAITVRPSAPSSNGTKLCHLGTWC